jgi:hypothetical protein
MTWRAIHRYGDGQFSLATNSGERRAPSPAEAREIALELNRFADDVDATRRPTVTGTDFLATGHLADPDVDFALFANKNHAIVAVVQVVGGCRLRCMACHLEGTRIYQNEDGAQAYARMLSGVRIPAWPQCMTEMP